MLVVWLVSVILTVPLAIYYSFSVPMTLVNLFYLCVPVLIVGYVNLELEWRNSQRRLLLEREAERKSYVAQIFQAQEDERKRIARELHDDTIHSLLLIANNVQGINVDESGRTLEKDSAKISAVRDDIIQVSEELRRLILDLRPGILDNIGLLPALRWQVDRLAQEGQVNTRMIVKGEERKIPPATEVIIFRIVQEALNNVNLHSAATKATLTLEFAENTVRIAVHDNGKGFHLPGRIGSLTSQGKLGLVGMQDRVQSLDGTFDVLSQPGKGTTILAELKV